MYATPDDVTDGFELKLTYNRDATITVQTGRITKAQELVRSPVRERMKEIDWKVVSDAEAASGHSKITRWTVDLSSLDLSKDYRLVVYWHTSLGRSFIAEKDIDESIIKARGVDLSKAEIRIMRLTASKQIAYLSGVSSFLLKAAKLQTTFQVFNEAKDKVGEAKDARIVVNPMEIGGSSYTVKCKVTNPKDETVWEKAVTVETETAKTDDQGGSSGNEDKTQTQGVDEKVAQTAQVFAERVSLSCIVYDPFEKQVRCVGENLYSISFFRRHGYEVNYCISSPETGGQAPPETSGQASEDKQVCNKQRVFFTFETGGEKTFN
ncbi:MAG: hypothetical protein JRJ31_22025, partial [Deltaproteobacteria bacterium]|nr:hypothetical protein [Deltaproteobacteria bacterium]